MSTSRRRLLGLCVTTGALSLAGCFGDDGDEPDDEETGNGDDEHGDSDGNGGDDSEGDDDDSGDLEIPEPVDWTDESRATIEVGPGGEHLLEPDSVRVETGTTLRWVWMSDGHTLDPTHQPDRGTFEGTESAEDAGFEYEFVPETPGEYRYVCEEHEGMVGYLVVE